MIQQTQRQDEVEEEESIARPMEGLEVEQEEEEDEEKGSAWCRQVKVSTARQERDQQPRTPGRGG